MAWFSKSEPADSIRPISQERLVELFKKEGWHYDIDGDGDLGGRWDNGYFFFILAGKAKEILHISARMREEIPAEVADEFLVFIEDWHREKIWPKLYHHYNDAGQMFLHAEVNVDYEFGATDAQLMQQIHCALGTSLQAFKTAKERFNLSSPDD
ncbi:YbjN domain-containing protein [Schaalia suimastitidis]|uniref:YbjN domain-containing protein n=1 Tax=Schaalia suimastitidis TaxID=121163 RepID=UPI0004235C33|nr:YbjN domain-containing protein [Schaalia suimastitidis]